jgi:hypothetical protein
VLTEGLFTAQCSLVIQLKGMHTAMQNQVQTVMGDLTAMVEGLPQLVVGMGYHIGILDVFFHHL